MAKIRFKQRSLIKRFGTGAIEVPDSLGKQYVERNQATYVKGIEEAKPLEEVLKEGPPALDEEELSGTSESPTEEKEEVPEEEPETQSQDSKEEEDKVEIKIKKPKGKK